MAVSVFFSFLIIYCVHNFCLLSQKIAPTSGKREKNLHSNKSVTVEEIYPLKFSNPKKWCLGFEKITKPFLVTWESDQILVVWLNSMTWFLSWSMSVGPDTIVVETLNWCNGWDTSKNWCVRVYLCFFPGNYFRRTLFFPDNDLQVFFYFFIFPWKKREERSLQ